jgi:predicted GH43/DUF377 family glycosyl hydrolase
MIMEVYRSEKNPIILPEKVKPSGTGLKVAGVFNCGVTRFKDEILLLMRVSETSVKSTLQKKFVPVLDVKTGKLIIKEFDRSDPLTDFSDPRFIRTSAGYYLTSISHLRIARSKNGIDFNVSEKPAMFPENKYEIFGMEDPRITLIDKKYYISYSAVSDITGITTCLASTTDFITFVRHGVIFLPDNKDIAIFPEKIKGRYYALSRPISAEYKTADMWISESDNLIYWGNHRRLMGIRERYWDNRKVGCGAVPFRIKEGWLEIYHGASESDRYCLGAVLLDSAEPWKLIARSEKPLIEPKMEYESNGSFGNVIFSCGVLHEKGTVRIYYGAADTYIAYAEIKLKDILYQLK